MNTYSELATVGRSYGETNFCTVITTALCLESTFEDAWNLLNAKGRKIGKGFVFRNYKEALEERGLTVAQIYSRHRMMNSRTGRVSGYSDPVVDSRFPRARYIKTVNDLKTYLPRHGKFMVLVKGHVLTFINGKVEDWSENRSHRVLSIHEVTGTPVRNLDATMPRGLARHREEGKTGYHAAVRTRTDTFQWELRRTDTGATVERYKRASKKLIASVRGGYITLTSDKSVPLVLVNIKTGVRYSKGEHPAIRFAW